MNCNLSHNYDSDDNQCHPRGQNTDVAMMCIGYNPMYCGSAKGSYYVLSKIMSDLDRCIEYWNNPNSIDLLQKSFGDLITEMTFIPCVNRICVALTDRFKGNHVTYKLL